MRSGLLDNRYYTMIHLTEILNAQRHQVEAAMLAVSFPPPSMKIGTKRFWEKETVEPFFPAMRDFLSGGEFHRNREELIADIRSWIHEQDLAKAEALRLRAEYLRWTAKGYSTRSVQYYGTWISLVLNAMKE